MDKSDVEVVLCLVFRYLNKFDLENVADVSRYWKIIAKNEILLRGPIVVLESKKRTDDTSETWISERENIIRHYNNRSCLQIFYNNNMRGKLLSDCHCSLLPPDSYSLFINTNCLINLTKQNILCSLYFPKTDRTRMATFTFIQGLSTDGLFCQEIRFNCGPDLREVKFLRYKLMPYFLKDNFTNTCMILFCKRGHTLSFLEFLQILSEWFPENKISGIWGGIFETLTVCQVVYKKQFCRVDAEFTTILINSPFMEVWNEILDDNDDTNIKIQEKLIFFKRRVKLRLHSIALVHVNNARFEKFHAIDISFLRQIFTGLNIFPTYGSGIIHGNSFHDFTQNYVCRSTNIMGAFTSIMIITYN